jgi:thymidylate synthase ThyX
MSTFESLKPDTVVSAGEEAEAVWDFTMDIISNSYHTLQMVGIPNQDCRGLLPTNVLTRIMMKCNLRTLADLIGKRKNLRAQGEYGDVAKQMHDLVLDLLPWTDKFFDPDRTTTPALDKLLTTALGNASPIDKPELNSALKELDALKGIWG